MRIKAIIFFCCALCVIGCKQVEDEEVHEDYGKFIELKEAEKLPAELGIPFNCTPKAPGDLGVNISDEFKQENGDEYEIEIDFYTMARVFNNQDPHNYSELIVQYLDENNTLQIDTIFNGQDCITSRVRNGRTYYLPRNEDRTYTIKKKSGDLFYFAVFNSPYGTVDFTSEIYVNGENEEPYYGMQYEYTRQQESYHITDKGVDYLIYSKAIYLP